MKEMLMNKDYSDVTLVTEDKIQMKAHKTILSACSPVFIDIFNSNDGKSPLIDLRGIEYSEMESIMQFIYLGEATFYEERMDKFFSAAKILEIKELCNSETKVKDEASLTNLERSTVKTEEQTGITAKSDEIKDLSNSENVEYYEVEDKSENMEYYEVEDKPTLSDSERSTDKTEEQAGITYQTENQAQQERRRDNFVVNNKYECAVCHKTYSSGSNLYTHMLSVHEGVTYKCNYCDFQGKTKGSLSLHIKSKHEGIKHACDQCDYQATRPDNLTRHVQSKHEGIQYSCDLCNYRSAWKGMLNSHKKLNHRPPN